MLLWLQYIIAILTTICVVFSSAEFTVQFDPASYTVDEADGVVSIRIVSNRPSPSANDGAALFYTEDDNATGKSYCNSTSTLW